MIKEKIFVLLVAVIVLTGCNLTEEDIETKILNRDPFYFFIVENNSDKNLDFTFKKGEEYNYIIYDDKGKEIYNYNNERTYIKDITKKTLIPGDRFSYGVDKNKIVLDKGEYTIIFEFLAEETYKRNQMEFVVK